MSSVPLPLVAVEPTADRREPSNQRPQLMDSLGVRLVEGVEMEHWQYKVTAGGGLWYCIEV